MDSFKIGNDEYSFEIVVPYTRRSLQVLHEEPLLVEDLFHRTIRVTRPTRRPVLDWRS